MGFSLIDIDPFATGNILGPSDKNKDGTPDANGGVPSANAGGNLAGNQAWSGDTTWTVDEAGNPVQATANQGYWGNYGNQALEEARQQGQQYQDALNQTGQATQEAGSQAASDLNTTGQNAANVGSGAQGNMAALGGRYGNALASTGQQYGSQLSQAGQQYANQLSQTGQASQNYALGSANNVGQTGNMLGLTGNNLITQAQGTGNRDISGLQQKALMGIERQAGPSAAQGQLALATSQNQANALAMARSGRGFGSSASAMRQAAQQRVGAQQQAANQSAILVAQEDAARRQRMAQNFGTSGQLATAQASTNDARQAALNQAGLGAMQAGGNLQLGSGQLGLSGYGQNLMAQQGAGNMAIGSLGQAANTELSSLGQAANTEIGANQSGYGMSLQGLGQQAQAQQGGGALNLQGLGQAGSLYGNAGNYGQNNLTLQGNIEQQGLGWEQQHTQNELTAAGINSGVALQQQNAANQMTGAYVGALGSVLPMVGMLSDRNAKEGIEPTNVTLKADEPTIITPEPGTAKPLDQNGQAYDPFSQGVGISGPNQAQGSSSSQASTAAAGASIGAAGGQPNPGKIDPAKYGGVGKGGNLWQTFGGAMRQAGEASQGNIGVNPVTGQSWYGNSGYNFQPYQAPMMGQMQPVTSDEREKEAIKAFDETPGYSYDYKDPEAMGATSGRQFGIMAQDLEKTPAGRSVVKKGPDGTKMVDTSRLALVEGAAINGLLKRIEALEGKKGKAA